MARFYEGRRNVRLGLPEAAGADGHGLTKTNESAAKDCALSVRMRPELPQARLTSQQGWRRS